MIKDAWISKDGLYRYTLTRDWDEELPTMLFIMLNPSTADAVEDDPTIRRCIGFAKRENCGAIEVANLFAFRATNPVDMKAAADPVGPSNDDLLYVASAESEIIVCGWGVHGAFQGRDKKVVDIIRSAGKVPYSFGTTKDGHPRHPLYLKNEAKLEEYII
jgi:hypothetical protein